MKKIILFFGLCFSFSLHSLWALTATTIEEPFFIKDQEWQQILYENEESHEYCSALLPASANIDIEVCDIMAFFYGVCNNRTIYIIAASIKDLSVFSYLSTKDLLNKFSARFKNEGKVSYVDAKNSGTKYCAEVKYFSGNKLLRIFVTKHHVYYAIVEGEDLSLASQFFDSIKIHD